MFNSNLQYLYRCSEVYDPITNMLFYLLLIILLGVTFRLLRTTRPCYHDFPRVGRGLLAPWIWWQPPTRWCLDAYEDEGYRKFSKTNLPFVMTMYGLDTLILPLKYLPHIRNFDRYKLSLAQMMHDNMQMQATVGDIAIANDLEIDLVTKGINPHLDDITTLLADEAKHVFQSTLGIIPGNCLSPALLNCTVEVSWARSDGNIESKPFNTFTFLSNLTINTSNRIFVGRTLARSPKYQRVFLYCMQGSFLHGVIWNFLPLGRARNWVYWISAIKFRWKMRAAASLLVPAIRERIARMNEVGTVNNGREKKQELRYTEGSGEDINVLHFAAEQMIAHPTEKDPYRHAMRVIQLTSAGTGTTITTLYRMIYQLLLHPEYVEPLRSEIAMALEDGGTWDDPKLLNGLVLMDSFIRETLRHHPVACVLAMRTARDEVQLDDVTLSAQSRIAFPVLGIHMDPEHDIDAGNFDGFSFAGPQWSSKYGARVGSSTVNEKFLSWGYGNQTCPGRFMAVRLVKIIFGQLVYGYDLNWVVAEDQRVMPKGTVIEGTFLPDITSEICIRSRR